MNQRYIGYFFILVAATCWAGLGPFGMLAMEQGIHPSEIAFWRAAFGGVLFLTHAVLAGSLCVHSNRDRIAFALFGIFAVAGFFIAYQGAVKYGGVALSALLLYTAPAWVALFSRILFGEELTMGKILAIGLSVAGTGLLSLSSGGQGGSVATAGVILGLTAGFLYALHYLFNKFYLSRYSAITIYAYCLTIGALAMFPFVIFSPKSFSAWIPLILIGVVSTYAGYWAYTEGIKRLELTRAAVTATLEPVLATFAAYMFWGESFRFLGWIGAVFVILAVIIMIVTNKRKNTGTPGPSHTATC